MRGSCFALVCTSAFFCASVAAAEDPYADYRIPAHNWHSWSAGFSAGGRHDLQQSEFGSRSTTGSLNGSGSTTYSGGYDSDPGSAAWSIHLNGFGQKTHASLESSDPSVTIERNDRDRALGQLVNGFPGWSHYPGE